MGAQNRQRVRIQRSGLPGRVESAGNWSAAAGGKQESGRKGNQRVDLQRTRERTGH